MAVLVELVTFASVAVTVTVTGPAAVVGVPEIFPVVLDNVSPAGSGVLVQVNMPDPPDALNVRGAETPTVLFWSIGAATTIGG